MTLATLFSVVRHCGGDRGPWKRVPARLLRTGDPGREKVLLLTLGPEAVPGPQKSRAKVVSKQPLEVENPSWARLARVSLFLCFQEGPIVHSHIMNPKSLKQKH